MRARTTKAIHTRKSAATAQKNEKDPRFVHQEDLETAFGKGAAITKELLLQ